jgi:hypothetical protein
MTTLDANVPLPDFDIDDAALATQVATLVQFAVRQASVGGDPSRAALLTARIGAGIERTVTMEVAKAVRAARMQGRSWAEIGAALGVTKQAAVKRFGGTSDPNLKRNLLIGGQVFTYGWVPGWVSCRGCSRTLAEAEGYSGPDRSMVRRPGEESAELLAFCEPCARQRARDTVGTASIDGEPHLCNVVSWSNANPDELEVGVLDVNPFIAPGEPAPLGIRRIQVATFVPKPLEDQWL